MSSSALKKIAFVEDDADLREIMTMSLSAIGGFALLACESGKQALEKIPGFVPDMIILDVMMPQMDGPTTFRELRRITSLENIPIVFMTAKVQPGEVASYLSLGAIDVISKPFDPMKLPEVLRKIWEKVQL